MVPAGSSHRIIFLPRLSTRVREFLLIMSLSPCVAPLRVVTTCCYSPCCSHPSWFLLLPSLTLGCSLAPGICLQWTSEGALGRMSYRQSRLPPKDVDKCDRIFWLNLIHGHSHMEGFHTRQSTASTVR